MTDLPPVLSAAQAIESLGGRDWQVVAGPHGDRQLWCIRYVSEVPHVLLCAQAIYPQPSADKAAYYVAEVQGIEPEGTTLRHVGMTPNEACSGVAEKLLDYTKRFLSRRKSEL